MAYNMITDIKLIFGILMCANSCLVTCCFARMNLMRQCLSFRSCCRTNLVSTVCDIYDAVLQWSKLVVNCQEFSNQLQPATQKCPVYTLVCAFIERTNIGKSCFHWVYSRLEFEKFTSCCLPFGYQWKQMMCWNEISKKYDTYILIKQNV